MFLACVLFCASILCASLISLPFPAGTMRIFGLLESSGLWYIRTSCNSSFGSSSAIAFASMDLPVPGIPSIITCLLWFAAFFTTSTACSWPMTCSINFFGTSISLVEVISNPPRISWLFDRFEYFPCYLNLLKGIILLISYSIIADLN